MRLSEQAIPHFSPPGSPRGVQGVPDVPAVRRLSSHPARLREKSAATRKWGLAAETIRGVRVVNP